MARRASARDLAALAAVQRVRVLAAQAALAAARTGEDDARAAEALALDAAQDAHQAWRHCLDRPLFAPEFARALAGEVLRRDGEQAAAGERSRIAAGLHDRRRDDWRLADARADATDDAHAAARRFESRRRDERALAAAGERARHRWSRQ